MALHFLLHHHKAHLCVHVFIREWAFMCEPLTACECMFQRPVLEWGVFQRQGLPVCVNFVYMFMYVCGKIYICCWLKLGFTCVCHDYVCMCSYERSCESLNYCMFFCACQCVCQSVCFVVGVVRLGVASVCHISHGVLSAGPSGGPLRFMECHSVAAAVNQVNVADPISSVVLRSRWKNNI